jgi:hypothetical protein
MRQSAPGSAPRRLRMRSHQSAQDAAQPRVVREQALGVEERVGGHGLTIDPVRRGVFRAPAGRARYSRPQRCTT